jgi:hypothetical protein
MAMELKISSALSNGYYLAVGKALVVSPKTDKETEVSVQAVVKKVSPDEEETELYMLEVNNEVAKTLIDGKEVSHFVHAEPAVLKKGKKLTYKQFYFQFKKSLKF